MRYLWFFFFLLLWSGFKIKIQVMKPGLSLETAYAEADRIDDELNEKFVFAFDDRLGYLTQCPTNLGTGMRASVLLHLPALTARLPKSL
jgi:protein arginine kinase